ISSVPVNFWLTKEKVLLGVDGEEGWKGLLLFNADRRTGVRFDPATNNLSLSGGSRTMSFPPVSLAGPSASMPFTTPSGEVPNESVKLSLSKQALWWRSSHDSIAATIPALQDVVLTMGSKSYRTTVLFDESGNANGLSSVRPCFVRAKRRLRVPQT